MKILGSGTQRTRMLKGLKGQAKVDATAFFDMGTHPRGFERFGEVLHALSTLKRECFVNMFRTATT